MAKKVIILASGETERRALPHLLAHLRGRGVSVEEVRIPPGSKPLSAKIATRLIYAAWNESLGVRSLDKFVVLLDGDGKRPDRVLEPFRTLSERLGDDLGVTVLCAYAQWHLEAWYFADATNLRGYLGRALGKIDASKPEGNQNPKLHLKHLLGEQVYTARVSEEIASRLDAPTIAERSPSFKGFLDAAMNGPGQHGG